MTFTANYSGAVGTALTALTPPFVFLAGGDDFNVDGSGAVRRTVFGTAQTFYGTYNDASTSQTINVTSMSSQNSGLMVLGSVLGGAVTGYYIRPQSGATSVRLWKNVAGTITQLAVSSAIADCTDIEFSVSISGGNPAFVVKRAGVTILTHTDSSSPITSGSYRGLFAFTTGAVTAGLAWVGYSDNSSNAPPVTVTIDERPDGYPFECIAGPPVISFTGAKGAGVAAMQLQIELEDGTIISAWSGTDLTYPTSTTWQYLASGAILTTLSTMRTDGKDYKIKVRETADNTNTVTQANRWTVGFVIPYNDQSLDTILSEKGLSPSAGAMSSVTSNNCRVMYAGTPLVANSGVTVTRLDNVANYGSGMMQMADEIGVQVAAGKIPNYPITFVNIAVAGQTMTDWNNDLAFGNWTLLQYMDYMLAQSGGRISALLRPVVVWSGSPATAITAMAQIVTDVEARIPNQPVGYTFPVKVRGAPRATRSASSVLNLRQVVDALGGQGGRYGKLCSPVIDMQLEGANELHQATGDPATTNSSATAHIQGNRRLGFRQGRGVAAFIQELLGLSVTIDRFGAAWQKQMFTSTAKTAIQVTTDRDVIVKDGSTSSIPQFYVSTDAAAVTSPATATWTECLATKTGTRTFQFNHPTGGNWVGQTVYFGYCMDSPWGSGDDTTVTPLLAKLVYDPVEDMVATGTPIGLLVSDVAATTLDITMQVLGGNTVTLPLVINP